MRAILVLIVLVVAGPAPAQDFPETFGLYVDPAFTQSTATVGSGTSAITAYLALTELPDFWDVLRIGFASVALVPSPGIVSITPVGTVTYRDVNPDPLGFLLFWDDCTSPTDGTYLVQTFEIVVTPQASIERIDLTGAADDVAAVGTCVPTGNFTNPTVNVSLEILSPVSADGRSWGAVKSLFD